MEREILKRTRGSPVLNRAHSLGRAQDSPIPVMVGSSEMLLATVILASVAEGAMAPVVYELSAETCCESCMFCLSSCSAVSVLI